jgi:hypothetical protein
MPKRVSGFQGTEAQHHQKAMEYAKKAEVAAYEGNCRQALINLGAALAHRDELPDHEAYRLRLDVEWVDRTINTANKFINKSCKVSSRRR